MPQIKRITSNKCKSRLRFITETKFAALVPAAMHALSALVATLSLLCIAAEMMARYFALIELRRIMSYGSRYDPVIRMRSPKQTSWLAGWLVGWLMRFSNSLSSTPHPWALLF